VQQGVVVALELVGAELRCSQDTLRDSLPAELRQPIDPVGHLGPSARAVEQLLVEALQLTLVRRSRTDQRLGPIEEIVAAEDAAEDLLRPGAVLPPTPYPGGNGPEG
jgi:hypothetical protein